jgi:hypothetical protein
MTVDHDRRIERRPRDLPHASSRVVSPDRSLIPELKRAPVGDQRPLLEDRSDGHGITASVGVPDVTGTNAAGFAASTTA